MAVSRPVSVLHIIQVPLCKDVTAQDGARLAGRDIQSHGLHPWTPRGTGKSDRSDSLAVAMSALISIYVGNLIWPKLDVARLREQLTCAERDDGIPRSRS